MKTLADILKNQPDVDCSPFPVLHKDGYAGEISGDRVVFFIFRVPNRKAAKEIPIPDYVGLHWAQYHPVRGWEGTIGMWQSQFREEDRHFFKRSEFTPV